MSKDFLFILALLGAFAFGWDMRKMFESTKKVKAEICKYEQNNSEGR